MSTLDLSSIPYPFRNRAAECFDGGNVGALCYVGNENALAFVYDNLIPLIERGLYEESLLSAYVGTRTNHSGWPIRTLCDLFGLANRERLLAAGDPLPPGDQFTIYRGVSGAGQCRKVRGFSWTGDYEKAAWFANRLPLPNPTVYTATVKRGEVLAYTNGREEQEFIVRPMVAHVFTPPPQNLGTKHPLPG